MKNIEKSTKTIDEHLGKKRYEPWNKSMKTIETNSLKTIKKSMKTKWIQTDYDRKRELTTPTSRFEHQVKF